jgi:hypothetical protein
MRTFALLWGTFWKPILIDGIRYLCGPISRLMELFAGDKLTPLLPPRFSILEISSKKWTGLTMLLGKNTVFSASD